MTTPHTNATSDRSRRTAQLLLVITYTIVLLAPFIVLPFADKPGRDSFGTAFAAGLGFVGMTSLVLQFVVASRIRILAAPFGQHVLVRFHTLMGIAIAGFVVAHVVVLMIDDPDRLALLNSITAPDRAKAAAIGLVALLLMWPLTRWRVRLKISYERWRLSHLMLAIVAVTASFFHIIRWNEYTSSPAMRWMTAGLVALALVAVFWLRILRPYYLAASPWKVKSIGQPAANYVTVELAADGHAGTPFAPGQFAWLTVDDSMYSLDEHPFSYASSATDPAHPVFAIKQIGDFTGALASLQPGQRVFVDGPHGSFHLDPAAQGRLLIAGGIGISPALSIIRTMAASGDKTHVVLLEFAQTREDLVFTEELHQLESQVPLVVVPVLSRPDAAWTGEQGFISRDLVARYVDPDIASWQVFCCGPPPMLDAAEQYLYEVGMPSKAVHMERFSGA